MLREDPKARPNIYQVVREVSAMRGTDVPIKDVSVVLLFRRNLANSEDLYGANSIGDSSKPASPYPRAQHSHSIYRWSPQSTRGGRQASNPRYHSDASR